MQLKNPDRQSAQRHVLTVRADCRHDDSEVAGRFHGSDPGRLDFTCFTCWLELSHVTRNNHALVTTSSITHTCRGVALVRGLRDLICKHDSKIILENVMVYAFTFRRTSCVDCKRIEGLTALDIWQSLKINFLKKTLHSAHLLSHIYPSRPIQPMANPKLLHWKRSMNMHQSTFFSQWCQDTPNSSELDVLFERDRRLVKITCKVRRWFR